MIDPITDNIYNILLSIVLGIIFVVFIDTLYDSPRIIDIYI